MSSLGGKGQREIKSDIRLVRNGSTIQYQVYTYVCIIFVPFVDVFIPHIAVVEILLCRNHLQREFPVKTPPRRP